MELPALKRLMGTYLTGDRPEGGGPWSAVDDFARREPTLASALRAEVDQLRSTASGESGVRHIMTHSFPSGYLPEADGWSYRFVLYGISDDPDDGGYDGDVIAWGLGFDDHVYVQTVDCQVGGRFSSADAMRRILFRRDRDIRLLWIDPEPEPET